MTISVRRKVDRAVNLGHKNLSEDGSETGL